MGLELSEVLKDGIFDGAEILCSEVAVSHIVNRISVFDCPYHKKIIDSGIIAEGDLFISCLEQFYKGDPSFYDFLECLSAYKSAGLIVTYSGNLDLLTPDVLEWCSNHSLPVILQKKTNFYADIMTAVNNLLSSENVNEINLLRLDRLRYAMMSDYERNSVIQAVNPWFKSVVRTLFISASENKRSARLSLWRDHIVNQSDAVVVGDDLIIILSSADEKHLKLHTNAVTGQLHQYIPEKHLGFSRIYPRMLLHQALAEGEQAVRIAEALNIVQQDYDPLLSLPILLAQGHSKEQADFYHTYTTRISENVSTDMLPTMLKTVECFVLCKGDYAAAAEELHTHANTIRYRINRIRSFLNMEDDPIRFYETIALATKIRALFDYEL